MRVCYQNKSWNRLIAMLFAVKVATVWSVVLVLIVGSTHLYDYSSEVTAGSIGLGIGLVVVVSCYMRCISMSVKTDDLSDSSGPIVIRNPLKIYVEADTLIVLRGRQRKLMPGVYVQRVRCRAIRRTILLYPVPDEASAVSISPRVAVAEKRTC